MKFLRLLIALVFFAGLSAPVFAGDQCSAGGKQCCAHSGEKSCGKGGEKEGCSSCPITEKIMKKAHFLLDNADEIGLSADQVKQIKDIKMQAKRSSIQEKSDMELFMFDVQAKLYEENLDVDGINAMIDEGGSAMAKGAKSKVQAYAKLKAVLSADQMTKAKEIWNKK